MWHVYNVSKKLSILTKITPIFTHIFHWSVVTWFAPSNNIFVRDTGPDVGFSFISRAIRSLLVMSLASSIISLPLYVTVTQCLRKFTPYPASVSCTTDISDHNANHGMTLPSLAAIGRCGRLSLPTCDDLSVVPSGMVTVVGLSAGVTLVVAAALMTRK